MRRFLILLLLLTIPLVCRGDGWFYGGVAAPGCASQSTEIEQTNIEGASALIATGTDSRGQSFTTSGAISLYSISIYIGAESMESGESGTLTIRVGAGLDLSSSYLGEATVDIANNTFSAGLYEAVFESPISLSATTTYYFACQWSLAETDGIYVEKSAASNVYAGGVPTYNTTDGSWSLSASSGYDLAFNIKKCD